MFRIGEFSRIARVSMRLLRYYDELGLLRPAHTAASNGYRYYTAAQVPELNRILVLRDLGLSLEQIARCLQDGISSQELRGMLLMRRAEIEQSQAELMTRMRMLESRIASLEGDGDGTLDDVVIRSEPDRRYLSLRTREPSFASAISLALELQRDIPQQVGRGVLGAFIAVSHSPEYEPDDLDLEFGFAIDAELHRVPKLANGRKLELGTLAGYPHVATCVRVGSPATAHLTTAKIGRYLEGAGYRLAGPNRETFLQLPRDGQLETSVVEMAFPIEPQPPG
ncbi:MAG TPA: MerR family transcriptional regulator [Polyangiales bacterium]|nr:MerR family transcriptional regulator [Polyangiales bacterium]